MYCKKCGHDEFEATMTVYSTVVVNGDGEYVETVEEAGYGDGEISHTLNCRRCEHENSKGDTDTVRTEDHFDFLYSGDNSLKSDTYDDGRFETGGTDIYKVLTLAFGNDDDKRRVWTMIEGDEGGLYLVAGYHLVNRIFHVITKEKWLHEEECYEVESPE